MSGDPADDLSGTWDGIFNYPRGHGSNTFVATLRDTGGRLVGETSEPSDGEGDAAATLIAWIEGRHDGGTVDFVKSYDDRSRADYTVAYRGQRSGDGLEITGTWTIPGIWSGTFIMVRPGAQTITTEAGVTERVG